MGAARMLHQWTRSVRRILPDVHGHQVKTLTLMALSLCRTKRCESTRLVLSAPVRVKLASTRRRFERFLANPRVDQTHISRRLAAAFTRGWDGRTVEVLLDETPFGSHLRCMKVSVSCHRRAMPLGWICYDDHDPPASQPMIVELLLRQIQPCLPPTASVVLMADRGLSWPLLIDLCRELGWDYLLRVQSQTVVELPDGAECQMAQLAPGRGHRWLGKARVFKNAGWRRSGVVAVWPAEQPEPWLLITSLPPRLKRCREYRRRMWQEQSFRDEKSHGYQWDRSHVRNPEHADRLLLAMQLAMWMTMTLGWEIDRRGWRHQVEATYRPTLSLFQLGHRAWHNAHLTALMIRGPTAIKLTPDDPPPKCVG